MLGRDNKPAEENGNRRYSGISRIKQGLNSRRKLSTGQMFESRQWNETCQGIC